MAENEGPTSDPRRRGTAWVRVGHGIKVPSGLTGRSALLAELRAWQAVLPDSAAWTGLTGAEVHGLWLPPPTGGPLFVATGTVKGEVYPVRGELAIARHPTPPAVVHVDGVRVEPVADCLRAAARFLPTLDLVVLIDAALQLRLSTVEELDKAAGCRRRGAPTMRAALRLANGLSESPWETLLRLLHEVCGIDVEPQVELFDAYGAFVARADLRVRGTNLLQEYDGAQHRDAAGQRKDLQRARRIADIDVVRRGYVAKDILDHPHLILRAADAALGSTTTSDVGPWLEMVGSSLYRPGGVMRSSDACGRTGTISRAARECDDGMLAVATCRQSPTGTRQQFQPPREAQVDPRTADEPGEDRQDGGPATQRHGRH